MSVFWSILSVSKLTVGARALSKHHIVTRVQAGGETVLKKMFVCNNLHPQTSACVMSMHAVLKPGDVLYV